MKPLDKAGLLVIKRSSSLATSVARPTPLCSAADGDRLGVQVVCFRSGGVAVGPPISEPATRPNVAAAMETTLPPTAPAVSRSDRKPRLCRAADKGDGAAADAQQRIAAEHLHHPAAEEVLQRDHHDGDDQAQHHGLAALEQRWNADCKADRCEEHDHEDGLQCAVKGDRGNAGRVEYS